MPDDVIDYDARHAQRMITLSEFWRDVPVDVIAEDLSFGANYLVFRLHQEKLKREAIGAGAN